MNYFHFIAEEIRAGLASLGLRSLDELTGRSDLLKQREHQLSKTEGLDLSFITQFAGPCKSTSERAKMEVIGCMAFLPLGTDDHNFPLGLQSRLAFLTVTP